MFYYWLYELVLINSEIDSLDFSYPSPYTEEMDDLIYDAALYCAVHRFDYEY